MNLSPLDSALPKNARKELFSYAFLAAIAASANCELLFPRMDYNSVDAQIVSTADTCPQIAVQVKATSSDCISNGILSFDLPVKNYNDLRRPRTVPNMLVVVHLPTLEKEWLEHGPDMISLRNGAYYLNLATLADTTNEETVRVRIPTTQQLRRESLEQLLAHVSKHRVLP